MRSRVGLHDSDACAAQILGPPDEQGVTHAEDQVVIFLRVPVRVVGVLVDGSVPAYVWARAPHGERFALAGEPPTKLGGVRLPRTTLLASELVVTAPDAEQIEIYVDYEVHALEDFARAHGLDFQTLAYGRQSFGTFHGYRIVGARPGEERQQVEAVAISRPAGRFGNNLMQLVQATHVARELGVDTVYVPTLPWFEIGSGGSSTDGLMYVSYSKSEEIAVPSLFGTFLFEDLEPTVTALAGVCHQRLVDRHVSSLFTPPPLGEPLPANRIAVHIRSGDLFDRPDPHPNFVQPPLAFFRLALSHFAATRSDVNVTLVYEDEGNPVIAALRSFLESIRISYSVSSSSLSDDLAVLLEHRALVLGRGSFGVAVAALSESVETLYFPWSEPRFAGLARARGLAGYLIDEIAPRYIEAGEWTNSAEQLRLMIEYPAENLTLQKCPPRLEKGPHWRPLL